MTAPPFAPDRDSGAPLAAPASISAQVPDIRRARLERRFLTPAGTLVGKAVTMAAANVAWTFARAEGDANYGVVAVPNWATTTYVTAKTVTGCTINFGFIAPANATVDALLFRSED